MKSKKKQTKKNLVNFDAWDDVGIAQAIDKSLAVLSRLVKRLLEENGTRDVIAEARSGEQKLPVGLTVVLRVIQPNRSEPLPTGCIRLIDREDTSPRRCHAFLLRKIRIRIRIRNNGLTLLKETNRVDKLN